MSMLESSTTHHYHHHHHHRHHAPQPYCHEPSTVEPVSGKIQLTLILPNGVPTALNVDANTPMMDLLVHAASLNKLNPSGYSLVVLDSNQHVIHFKANQTVGQVVTNCHLPQINGSSTISLLPKETIHSQATSKPKAQPFEITVRLQVNLPDAQKILLRVDPTLPLHEIKEQICKQKKYTNSHEYTLCLPNKIEESLLLGLSLAECKTNELTLVHLRTIGNQTKKNYCPLQSFDRLYRIRSESQPPKDSPREFFQEQDKIIKEIQPINSNRSSAFRPSHTSLHAYWNDPNFDTQSQISNCSSTTKKRAAPRAPSHISPHKFDPQIVDVHQTKDATTVRFDHHQSQESLLSENGKRKRKAPILVPTNSVDKKENQQQTSTDPLTRPGLEPPPPPPPPPPSIKSAETVEEKICETTIDNQMSLNLSKVEEPINETMEKTNEQKEPLNESLVSDVQQSSPIDREKTEEKFVQKTAKLNEEILQTCSSTKPSRDGKKKEKKSSSVNGLLQIINDHQERAQNHRDSKESVSYFRVAKSRFGKFETDNNGFVFRSDPIFNEAKRDESIEINQTQKETKEKRDPMKNSQNEQSFSSSINKTIEPILSTNQQDRIHAPIQLEVTERTTHITVTVESDAKQTLTRVSPLNQPSSGPTVPPKSFSKTISEHRIIRRTGNDGQTATTVENKISPSVSSRQSLMESIRQFGGSKNLSKK